MDIKAICCFLLIFPKNFVFSNDADMKFYLFKRPNINYSIVLNSANPHELVKANKIILYTHGINSYSQEPLNLLLKNKYLQRYNCNFILVDWAKIAKKNYLTIVEKSLYLGSLLATFLCQIQKQLSISLQTIHLVGHSLGAHISGLAGQFTVELCKEEIGRITGLDPAGPIFQKFPKDKRLSSNDGTFVEVVHTNALMAGYYGNCGDVDFYVNCGTQQNGCPENTPEGMLLKNSLSCNHVRALHYWMESVSSDGFMAQSCSECPFVCKGDEKPEYVVMGENSLRNSSKRTFRLPTTSKSPYGGGCCLYDDGCS